MNGLVITLFHLIGVAMAQYSDWPYIVIHEGGTGSLPCTPQIKQATTFFWRVGERFESSDPLGKFDNGTDQQVSERFVVLGNGTLTISDISKEDEGKYYCRKLSIDNDSYGTVRVYVQAKEVPEKTTLSIAECSTSGSCTLHFEPSTPITLTCEAENVAESTSLRWLGASGQPLNNSGDVLYYQENKISRNIKLTYDHPSIVTCQATDDVFRSVDGRVVVVYLDDIGDSSTSKGLIIALVILCIVVAILFVLVVVYRVRSSKSESKPKKEDDTKQDEEKNIEEHPLLINANKELVDLRLDVDSKKERIEELEKEVLDINFKLHETQAKLVKEAQATSEI